MFWYLIRHLKRHLVLDCFPQKYMESEIFTAVVNALKRTPDRKGRGGRNKDLEVVSVDFNADKIEKGNWLIGLEEKKDTSGDSIKEI